MTHAKLTPETMDFENMDQLDAAVATLKEHIHEYDRQELIAISDHLRITGDRLKAEADELAKHGGHRQRAKIGLTLVGGSHHGNQNPQT